MTETKPLARRELETRLRELALRYHDRHPFHVRMNAGELDAEEVRRWAANRFYYQRSIPLKDAAILANCPDQAVRRAWVRRVLDHDGQASGTGGIDSWLRLAEAVGLQRDVVLGGTLVLPGVRFAVDAYVEFCRRRPWLEAVATSLTELFGPAAMSVRLDALNRHYRWIAPDGLAYFIERIRRAPDDAEYALRVILDRCHDRQNQERAVSALAFKCDVLWAQLDAIAAGETRPMQVP